MKCGRTSRQRRRKFSQKPLITELLPDRLLSQWMYTNGFNKRDYHLAVKCFNGCCFFLLLVFESL